MVLTGKENVQPILFTHEAVVITIYSSNYRQKNLDKTQKTT